MQTMSHTETPAVARRRVRLALRSAREAKRLTQHQIARAMDWSLSKVIRIEKGEVNVSPGDLKQLLDHLDVRDPAQVTSLLDDARRSRQERWTIDPAVREHMSPAMLEVFQFEHEATAIRYFDNLVVPGPLQVPAYSRAIFAGLPHALDTVTVDARIAVRQRRLAPLYRVPPPDYHVVLDESVLLRPFGGPAAMAAQLDHLDRLLDSTPLRVRILPFASPSPVLSIYGSFLLHDLEGQSAVLYREGPHGDEIVHAEAELARHRTIFEQVWSVALDDEASRARIATRAAAMRTG
jgi:transcriptional regulator with XRE-family HTH domain